MQKEIFGFNALHYLNELVDEFNPKKIFLVTGKRSFSLSGTEKRVYDLLKDASFVRFSSFSQNPDIKDVKRGVSLFKKNDPDTVVSIGGGSVIDMAKAVNILAAQDDEPEFYIKGKKLLNPGRPLIAVPTTAGTGSEATHFATIYIDKKKFSLSSQLMLPTVSIVDPSLTVSVPKYLTASTGLDALCQGIESFWSINSTEKSREYARKAIEITLENIERAVNNPDRESRLGMAKAAHISGKAINISKTTACHSVSYPITSYFGIPHGHAVALTMPPFIEFNSMVSDEDCNDKRGSDFVKENLEELFSMMDYQSAVEAKNKFRELMVRIGIKTRLSELNIESKGIDLILNEGFALNRMENNPRNVTKEGLRNILEEIR